MCMQQHLFEHFGSEDYSEFLDEVKIDFIDRADPKKPQQIGMLLETHYKKYDTWWL